MSLVFGCKQSGQALPLGLAATLSIGILTIVLFNTGQVTSQKMRLANTADAAAYSGLVWQARALNFQSYTNRAMVANQVAIAQAVSLASWSSHMDVALSNLSKLLTFVPGLGQFLHGADQAHEVMDPIIQKTVAVAISITDRLLDALSASQRAVHIATAVTTTEIVHKVVKRNDSHYELSLLNVDWLARNVTAWNAFTDTYSSDKDLQRKVEVINRSRDPFTRDRSWEFTLAPAAFGGSTVVRDVELLKRGETRLLHKHRQRERSVANGPEWQWKGKDNLSLHYEYFRCTWRGCGWRHQEIPLGWGAGFVSTNGKDLESCRQGLGFFNARCPAWSENKNAERLADARMTEIKARYNGPRAYRDMADLSVDNKDPRLALSVEVQVQGDDVRTWSKISGKGSAAETDSSRVRIGEGSFKVRDRYANPVVGSQAVLSAISKGEVYFKRPPNHELNRSRADTYPNAEHEYGNLFNPYWTVRLISADKERLQAWTSKNLDYVSGSSGTGGQL